MTRTLRVVGEGRLDVRKCGRESTLFAEHLDIIRPFIENSAPGIYEILYEADSR